MELLDPGVFALPELLVQACFGAGTCQAAIDDEIERVCAVATTRDTYETPVTGIASWRPDWEPITTRAELEVAVEQCAAPERERLAEQHHAAMAAAVDAEIERACAAAIENYNEPIGSFPQWDPEWELVMTRLQQIEAVERCAGPERDRLIREELQAAVDAEIERACAIASKRTTTSEFGLLFSAPSVIRQQLAEPTTFRLSVSRKWSWSKRTESSALTP